MSLFKKKEIELYLVNYPEGIQYVIVFDVALKETGTRFTISVQLNHLVLIKCNIQVTNNFLDCIHKTLAYYLT